MKCLIRPFESSHTYASFISADVNPKLLAYIGWTCRRDLVEALFATDDPSFLHSEHAESLSEQFSQIIRVDTKHACVRFGGIDEGT